MSGPALTFEAADLQAIADSYDAAAHEAPIVVGHPSHDAPAYGWVKRMDVVDGSLFADVDQVDPAFAELVEAGRFKKVSASFLKPGARNNPKPDGWYLNHIGFLGAKAPAVKGLRQAQFADASEVVTFGAYTERTVASLLRSLRDWIIETNDTETADRVLPSWQLDGLQEDAGREDSTAAPGFAEPEPTTTQTDEDSMDDAEQLKADRAAFEQEKAEFAEQQARETERRAAERQANADAFAARLVNEGRLAPALKSGVASFMVGLDDGDGTIEFAAGDKTEKVSPLTFFQALMAAQPPQIDFGEVSAPDGKLLPAASAANFAAPDGYTVDQRGLKIDAAAKAFQRQNPGTAYIDAVIAVGG